MKRLYPFIILFAIALSFCDFFNVITNKDTVYIDASTIDRAKTIDYLKKKNSFLLNSKKELIVENFVKEIIPEKELSSTCIDIIRHLKNDHYREVYIDDNFSSKVFEIFFSELDPLKFYFLSSDLKEFEPWRNQLDDAMKSGDLSCVFKIYNRYQRRYVESLIYMIKELQKNIDKYNFDLDENIETNRKNLPWAKNLNEQQNLWRKRLKSDVLILKLDKKSLNEIKDTLLKRYQNQLNRVSQLNSKDGFREYMDAVTQIFDPHTQYFPPRLSDNFNIRMSLSLEGIGAMLQTENEYTKVVRLVPPGPAEKSKILKPGDLIVGVGQGMDSEIIDVIGWRIDDVVQLIRGPKKTIVRLKIIPSDNHGNQKFKIINITRNTVKLEEQSAKKEIIEFKQKGSIFKIGIINIPTFYFDFRAYMRNQPDYKSTTRDVRRLLNELKKENIDGVIIDLRNNGGGALQEANTLTGMFIKTGPVVKVKGTTGSQGEVLRDNDPEIVYNGPLIVVVNRLSASASEIFAGAIQDYKRGIIIGTRTFGKGTVQSLLTLKQGQLKLTHAKFYRVSGESTQHKGVIPDIVLPEIYDPDKIGESSLPEALPWDKIAPSFYFPYPDTVEMVEQLSSLHKKRVKKSPDYIHLVELNNILKEMRKKTTISLKEKERLAEQLKSDKIRLELENKRRISNGMKPLKSLDELKDIDEDKSDPLLKECEYILIDYIKLSNLKSDQELTKVN